MKVIILYFFITISLSWADIRSFNSNNSISASQINENYDYINSELQGYPLVLDFQKFQSGEVISLEKFNLNASFIKDLNPLASLPEISNQEIKSSDLNNHFNAFITQINNYWKLTSCEEIINSPRYSGPGEYWIDLDGSGPESPLNVYCTNQRKTKQFYVLNGENSKTLKNNRTTNYLLDLAQKATTSVSSLSFSGTHTLNHNGTEISTELFEYSAGTYNSTNYCNTTPDATMCMVRFSGDIVLNGTHTTFTRKKGLVIYIDGNLTLNGTISMTARGAIAEGQNLYLIENYNVGAVGGAGGLGRQHGTGHINNTGGGNAYFNQNQGGDAINGASGGGAAGGSANYSGYYATGGNGAAGTSYSGGSGGGGATARSCTTAGGHAAPNGGAGGSANGCWDWAVWGGAGNPGGVKKTNNAYENVGSSGTGGLLIIYVKGNLILNSSASIQSDGTASGSYGGSSGAGSVNVFYTGDLSNSGSIRANGVVGGGYRRSGNGTVRIIKSSF